jgi:hypothetical protein
MLGYNAVSEEHSLHLQGRINRTRSHRISFGSLDPEDGGGIPPKRILIFNGLHGVISQKIALFMTTAVRISNPSQSRQSAGDSLLTQGHK